MFTVKTLAVSCLGLMSIASAASASTAGTWETGKVNEIRTVVGQNQVSFSLNSERIHNGCSGDDSFFFDATTTSGKLLYAALLSAKASGKNTNIWVASLKSSSTGSCSNFQWNITVFDVAP